MAEEPFAPTTEREASAVADRRAKFAAGKAALAAPVAEKPPEGAPKAKEEAPKPKPKAEAKPVEPEAEEEIEEEPAKAAKPVESSAERIARLVEEKRALRRELANKPPAPEAPAVDPKLAEGAAKFAKAQRLIDAGLPLAAAKILGIDPGKFLADFSTGTSDGAQAKIQAILDEKVEDSKPAASAKDESKLEIENKRLRAELQEQAVMGHISSVITSDPATFAYLNVDPEDSIQRVYERANKEAAEYTRKYKRQPSRELAQHLVLLAAEDLEAKLVEKATKYAALHKPAPTEKPKPKVFKRANSIPADQADAPRETASEINARRAQDAKEKFWAGIAANRVGQKQ